MNTPFKIPSVRFSAIDRVPNNTKIGMGWFTLVYNPGNDKTYKAEMLELPFAANTDIFRIVPRGTFYSEWASGKLKAGRATRITNRTGTRPNSDVVVAEVDTRKVGFAVELYPDTKDSAGNVVALGAAIPVIYNPGNDTITPYAGGVATPNEPITALEITPNVFDCSPGLLALNIAKLVWLKPDANTTIPVNAIFSGTLLFSTGRPLDGSVLAYIDANGDIVPVSTNQPGPVIELSLSATPPMLNADPPVFPWRLYPITGDWNAAGVDSTVYVASLTNKRWANLGWILDSHDEPKLVNVDVRAQTWNEFEYVSPEFTFISTENVGGIHRGDTVKTRELALRQMLETYQFPGFIYFLLNGQGSIVVPTGTQFGAGFKSFTWATSNSANVLPNSLALQDITANSLMTNNEADDGVLSASTASFVVMLGETQRYRLSGMNSKGNIFIADIVISGETESYFGLSNAMALSASDLVALGNAQLQGSRNRTINGITASGGQYLYYAYDARHEDLTGIILDGAAPVLGAFQRLADVPSTNSTGGAVTLRVYRSNAPNAFSNNSLAFS